MSLACVFIPFLPASNLFFRVGFVIAERILYLPSLGYCMLVALGMEYLHDKTEKKVVSTRICSKYNLVCEHIYIVITAHNYKHERGATAFY